MFCILLCTPPYLLLNFAAISSSTASPSDVMKRSSTYTNILPVDLSRCLEKEHTSYTHSQRTLATDRILVYVEDLFITSDGDAVLDDIDAKLRSKYGGVTSKKGQLHEYLSIKWDFTEPGQVSLSMEGYINDIFAKHKVGKLYKNPANDNPFVVCEKSPELNNDKRESFHSASAICVS